MLTLSRLEAIRVARLSPSGDLLDTAKWGSSVGECQLELLVKAQISHCGSKYLRNWSSLSYLSTYPKDIESRERFIK